MDSISKYNKYYIEIEFVNEDSLLVFVPANLLLEQPERFLQIDLIEEGLKFTNDKTGEVYLFECEEYEKRPKVYEWLQHALNNRNMSESLVEGLENIVKLKEPYEIEKEKEFFKELKWKS